MEKKKEAAAGTAVLFVIGAVGYCLLEILWRGHTHWSMGVAGGICLVGLYGLHRRMAGRSLVLQAAAGAALITAVEFCVGCVVNLLLGWNVWDYSRAPGNLMGQVCPMYFLLWYFLCYPIGLLNGMLRKAFGKRPIG